MRACGGCDGEGWAAYVRAEGAMELRIWAACGGVQPGARRTRVEDVDVVEEDVVVLGDVPVAPADDVHLLADDARAVARAAQRRRVVDGARRPRRRLDVELDEDVVAPGRRQQW